MPIPLIVWGIAAVVGVITAATVITFACLTGKKVAFIGMKGAGKTTAVHAFRAVGEKNKNWTASKFEGTLDNVKEHKVFDFEVCIDTSGAQELKRNWETTIKNVDVVFYFFNISRLEEIMAFSGGEKARYSALVKADLRDIAEICRGESKKIVVLATHTDISGYDKNTADHLCGDILKELPDYKFVKGSLKNYDSAVQMAKEIEEKLK